MKTKKITILIVATILLSIVAVIASNGEYVTPVTAQNEANKLIDNVKTRAQIGIDSVGREWQQVQAGAPVLVHDLKNTPKYYIVPGIKPDGEVVTRVGVDAETGEWQWYVEECLIKNFPPVSGEDAKNAALNFIKKRSISGQIDAPLCVSMPNKKLYWVFHVSGGGQTTDIYVDFDNVSEIYTNFNETELGLGVPPRDLLSDYRVQFPSIELSGRQELTLYSIPSSHDIPIKYQCQEETYYCGEACLAILFDYYGPNISQDEIAAVTKNDEGSSNFDLRRAAHFSGYSQRPFGYGAHEGGGRGYYDSLGRKVCTTDSWLSNLKEVIANNYPVIVLQWDTTAEGAGHYRVVKGYNSSEIITHDPWCFDATYAGKNHRFSYKTFNDLWEYNCYWGMMVSPWNISFTVSPTTVSQGATFTVGAKVEYVYDSHFDKKYYASNSKAEISVKPLSVFKLANDEEKIKTISVKAPGSSDTVNWNVVAPASPGKYKIEIEVVADGSVSGKSKSYPNYMDRIGGSTTATVSIIVEEKNNPPVAYNQSVITDEDIPVDITLTGSDKDNDPLTFHVVSNPSNGSLSGTAPNVTYTPNAGFYGGDSFKFKVNDGKVDSNIATVSITVNALHVALVPGLNIMSVPLKDAIVFIGESEESVKDLNNEPLVIKTIGDLRTVLGDDLVAFFHYDTSVGKFLTEDIDAVEIQGDIGYVVQVLAPVSIKFQGLAWPGMLELKAGLNVVAVPLANAIPEGSELPIVTIGDLKAALGDDLVGFYYYDTEEGIFFRNDPGIDAIEIKGGVGYIAQMTDGVSIPITGDPWTNEESTAAPAGWQLRAYDSTSTPIIGVNGTVVSEDTGLAFNDLSVTVRHLSSGIALTDTTGFHSKDGRFSAVFLDIVNNHSVDVGDVFKIDFSNTDGALECESVRHIVTEEDIRHGRIAFGKVFARFIPKHSQLLQNYPNPFNPETWLPYQLAQDANVIISIYNIKGQLVRTLYLGNKNAGVYVAKDKAAYWDGTDNLGQKITSGVYYYTLKAGNFVATRKLVILK